MGIIPLIICGAPAMAALGELWLEQLLPPFVARSTLAGSEIYDKFRCYKRIDP